MKTTDKKSRHNWRPFEKARVFVRTLGLKNQGEWNRWRKTDARPSDIPTSPNITYKDSGWISWGDWFGTGFIANKARVYRSFFEARIFIQGLGLKNESQWRKWSKSKARPNDIPAYPDGVYKKNGWAGWGDWLGTGRIANFNIVYRPFEEARAFVRRLGLHNQAAWRSWAKSDSRPNDIPSTPNIVYKNQGWAGVGDWLGTGRVANRYKIYRSFHEARTFVRNIGLQSKSEWDTWIKTNVRPDDIPVQPSGIYKGKGWISWGDWLGTDYIANQNRAFISYNEARKFVHKFDIKNKDQWFKWAKSSEHPQNIPVDPSKVYKNKGWKGWGNWLGTSRIANQDKIYRPFQEARSYVHTLNIRGQSEWRAAIKKNLIPDDIPARPDSVYKNKGWNNWGDWLGTGRVTTSDRLYRSFEDARTVARSLGLQNRTEWVIWTRSDSCPNDIPASPAHVYFKKGWQGWGNWLGTRNRKGGYLTYGEARLFAQSLNFKNLNEWKSWAKSNLRPDNIPASPEMVYKNKGWTGWGDWLGTGRIATQDKIYRPFNEARAFARTLRLKDKDAWHEWTKKYQRPNDIPATPAGVYRKSGWAGWADWLGAFNRWNQNSILSFLNGIKPVLHGLQPAELYSIMRQNGMLTSVATNSQTQVAPLIKSIRDLCSSPNPESDFEKLIAEIERENNLAEELDTETPDTETLEIIPETDQPEALPALRSLQALKAVDELVQAGVTSDDETIEFLIANRVSWLWQDMLNNGGVIDLDTLRNEKGGVYFETIRSRFLSQYDGAQSLVIPRGYDFRVEGVLAQPNLMQKLAAYRVRTEKRLGNWSGVGAGKTLSAILASRVIDARLTVIVAFNSTVTPWAMRIKETYPDSIIHIKERGTIHIDPSRHTYLILNFETFQQPDSAAMVARLVERHKINFVVLDEIQSVKQRTPKMTSKRRQVVSGLLTTAGEKNPDLCVLGMSATPVINNLYEAKALLELVRGVSFDELETFSNIPNAIAMHEKLILYGIRYRPEYKQTIETEIIEIQGNDFLPRLVKLRKGAILDLERVLLDAKIETVLSSLKKGTLIYTHYLTGLVTPLRHAIEKAGFKVGLFTGEDKSGLDLFKKGKVDVLIGSVPVGTGVDGLQYVCNRMIVVSLPWTSAEYEQLIGRLYRQGSAFDKVEVIVPQVVLEHNDDIWSWDRMRMNRIQYKKTLADAAMDGVIPEAELSSPETMYKKAHEALQTWIQRIKEDGVAIIERAQLKVPLPKETAQIIQRRFGDLSVMNSRINTSYSSTTHERLKENPEEWYLYHTLYREARKDWAEIPFERIAKSLKKRPDWVIGDFGCGEAKLAALLPNKVYSFDHVAINEKVLACDITHVPVDDGTLDVAVFSLSLMGLNYADYLKEAHRTLRFGGLLKISEPISRWSEKRPELLATIAEAGFSLVGQVEESNQFLYIDALKIME